MRAFDPTEWLSRFTEAGGWYCATGDRLWFGWPIPTIGAAVVTRAVYREIEDVPDRREAVAELIARRP